MMNQTRVILFDGICTMCCGWVQFLLRHDKQSKFRFAPLQSESGERLLHAIGLTGLKIETVVYVKGPDYFRESSAILEILKDMGGVWTLFGVLKLIPKALRDIFYQFIARNRYRMFGKRTSCYLPTPENRKRFLT